MSLPEALSNLHGKSFGAARSHAATVACNGQVDAATREIEFSKIRDAAAKQRWLQRR
jgi:hypothetical protein